MRWNCVDLMGERVSSEMWAIAEGNALKWGTGVRYEVVWLLESCQS